MPALRLVEMTGVAGSQIFSLRRQAVPCLKIDCSDLFAPLQYGETKCRKVPVPLSSKRETRNTASSMPLNAEPSSSGDHAAITG